MTTSAEPVRAFCLTGPTGCGKTELALSLVDALPLEIVSMDSALVYRGMDIGTAKPSAAVLGRYPHHLVDIRDPEDAYSAGRFSADARCAIESIRARGKWPLIVGGTFLYLRALREGLADLPERKPELRRALDEQAAAVGWPALHARLREVDPEAAARIEPGDRQRIQRALEVYMLAGEPLTVLTRRAKTAAAAGAAVEVATFAVVPADRSALGERLERRFDAMVRAGLLDEVERLRARPRLRASHASMRSVGYRQVWAHLAGEIDWPEARRRAVVATRQLAKRQMTWLRSERGYEALPAFDGALATELRARVLRRLTEWQ